MPPRTSRPVLVFIVTAGVVLACAPVAADVNVAAGKAAEQSTTDYGGDAARAVDGNTDGNWGANSVTHTRVDDLAPFWQVDLGQEISLTRFVVWNRTDCCPERLTNFRISILDAGLGEVEGQTFFTDLTFPPGPDFEYALPPGTAGQYVRIDKLSADTGGTTVLSLAEVEAFTDATIAPTIIRGPVGGKFFAGGSFTLTVAATGSEPLSYKWKKGVDDVPGATSSSLTFSPLTLADTGTYTVTVKNGAGEVTSDPAVLRVFAGRNLARDGEARQSTTDAGGLASRAIDGNTSGEFFASTVTHTADGDPSPAWEVLLYAPSAIETIFIWNRTDCCPERLHNFRVLLLDGDRNVLHDEDFFTDGTYPDTALEGFEVPVPGSPTGQIVRIEHLGSVNGAPRLLSLAEVEIIGQGPLPPPDPDLVRRGGVAATQSSNYAGGAFPASFGIDGSLGTFSHTDVGVNLPGTWEVNLGAENDIGEIVVWNRTDCCGSRLRDITLSVLNLAGDQTLFTSELLNAENELGAYPDGPEKLALDLVQLTGGAVRGGRVRVVREPDPDLSGSTGQGNEGEPDVLSVAEVQVLVPANCPAAGDTHCLPASFAVEGPPGGIAGSYRAAAAGSDDSGDGVRYTFSADDGRGRVITAGTHTWRDATFLLGIGSWTVAAEVDDDPRCDDRAADAVCSRTVDVAAKPGNKAPGGTASQSSTAYGAGAELAVDGISSGVFANGSVTHTTPGDFAPWWELELPATSEIQRVVIWNRTDSCCAQRLTNFRVSILDADRVEVAGGDHFTDFSFPDTSVAGYAAFFARGTRGRIVRIALLSGVIGALSLAEVEVYCWEQCSGGTDDDGDGKIDCADEDCSASPLCGVGPRFVRGDANGDGRVNITDPIFSLAFSFGGGGAPPCLDAADVDDDGKLNITDPIVDLNWLFQGGPAPRPPSPATGTYTPADCGGDPTPGDTLGCAGFAPCGA